MKRIPAINNHFIKKTVHHRRENDNKKIRTCSQIMSNGKRFAKKKDKYISFFYEFYSRSLFFSFRQKMVHT